MQFVFLLWTYICYYISSEQCHALLDLNINHTISEDIRKHCYLVLKLFLEHCFVCFWLLRSNPKASLNPLYLSIGENVIIQCNFLSRASIVESFNLLRGSWTI